MCIRDRAKTIADETGKLTAYEISANSLTELEAAMTELEKAIDAFKPAPTTVEQAQSYAALSLRLENLYEQISSRYKTINDDYMQNRITTSEYNSLNSRANSCLLYTSWGMRTTAPSPAPSIPM